MSNIHDHEQFTSQSIYEGQNFDILLHAWLGRLTGSLSPASVCLALFDWYIHLFIAPAKQFDLAKKSWEYVTEYFLYCAACAGCPVTDECTFPKLKNDPRFKDSSWLQFPYNYYAEAFLLYNQWWEMTTSNVRGVTKHHQEVVNFIIRQMIDMFSPSNSPFTNPEIIEASVKEGGVNFVHGFSNLVEDYWRYHRNLPPAGSEKFKVGIDLAVTPGKVIYQNQLIELIQYEPSTQTVYEEPILIIPAWIMKYYILDLSPHNSLVKYMVDHGHTVFMISWKNPGSEDRNLGLEDYFQLGIMKSLDVINKIIPKQKIHAAGYCLGGTLLMIAAAWMAHQDDKRLKSATLFAAQTDFRNSGELSLFIDESQISYLEDIMREKGYLDGTQMAWAFSMLRSNDLIWSRIIHHYLLGKRQPMNDLMAWNSDATRLPFRMHSEYLHTLFLNNDLVQGRFHIGNKRISLADIKLPIFVVSTTRDHISPWRSVYKIHLFTSTTITFVLTTGGHNVGIVNEPGGKRTHNYQIRTRKAGEKQTSSDSWLERAEKHDGSWWPAWEAWLTNLSGNKVPPPPMGNPAKDLPVLYDAPGTYVLKK